MSKRHPGDTAGTLRDRIGFMPAESSLGEVEVLTR